MWDVRRTPEFDDWLTGLADRKSRVVITRRLSRVARGLLGDVKPVGDSARR